MSKTKFEAQGSQLTVTRTFNAPIDLVWRAWTEADLLDQWWAPSPWKSKTKSMEFHVGGSRLYAMCGPNGEEHWGLTRYHTINKPLHFAGEDAFCNSEGTINPEFPLAQFENRFEENSNSTTVIVKTQYASEKDLQQVIAMGMKEGLSMAYENLDQLIETIQSSKSS